MTSGRYFCVIFIRCRFDFCFPCCPVICYLSLYQLTSLETKKHDGMTLHVYMVSLLYLNLSHFHFSVFLQGSLSFLCLICLLILYLLLTHMIPANHLHCLVRFDYTRTTALLPITCYYKFPGREYLIHDLRDMMFKYFMMAWLFMIVSGIRTPYVAGIQVSCTIKILYAYSTNLQISHGLTAT